VFTDAVMNIQGNDKNRVTINLPRFALPVSDKPSQQVRIWCKRRSLVCSLPVRAMIDIFVSIVFVLFCFVFCFCFLCRCRCFRFIATPREELNTRNSCVTWLNFNGILYPFPGNDNSATVSRGN